MPVFKIVRFSNFLDYQTFLTFARAYSLKCFKLFSLQLWFKVFLVSNCFTTYVYFEIINFTYAILLQLLNYHFIFRYHIFLYESFHEGLWPTLFSRMKNFDLLQLTFQGRYLRTSVEQMVLYWFELILLSGQLILVTLVSVLEACIPFGSEINQPKYHFQEF